MLYEAFLEFDRDDGLSVAILHGEAETFAPAPI